MEEKKTFFHHEMQFFLLFIRYLRDIRLLLTELCQNFTNHKIVVSHNYAILCQIMRHLDIFMSTSLLASGNI